MIKNTTLNCIRDEVESKCVRGEIQHHRDVLPQRQYLIDNTWEDEKNVDEESIKAYEDISNPTTLMRRIKYEINEYESGQRCEDDHIDPLLIIKWDDIGITQRAADVPAGLVADPGTTARTTRQFNILTHTYPTGRPVFNQQLFETILTTSDNGNAIGQMPCGHVQGITLIKYATIPEFQQQVNRLMRLCFLLRSDCDQYPNNSGVMFRAYTYTTGRPISADIQTVRMACLDY
jgi:hypothetical protein